MIGKRELRREVHDFCASFMYEFLRQEVKLVPSLDTYVRKLSWDATVLDFFSANELKREFLIWSGLDEEVFDELDMEFPSDFMTEIATGSEEGKLRWLRDNVEKLCRDQGVSRMWIVERLPSGWVVVLENEGLSVGEVVEWLKERGVNVNSNRVHLFKVGEHVNAEDDKWFDWFSVLTLWKTRAVEVYEYSDEEEMSEGVVLRVRDFFNELVEAIAIDALYRGAYEYMKKQPGKVDRVWKSEIMKRKVTELTFLPFFGTRVLLIQAKVRSEEDPKVYPVTIAVHDMDFSKEFTEWTPVRALDKKTHEEFYMRFIELDDEVRVKCGCMDFQCRFARVLKGMRALIGGIHCPPRRTLRKSINWARVASACKHILAVFEVLVDAGVIKTRVQPSRRVIDLVRGIWVRV
jgi:hypothetical protein